MATVYESLRSIQSKTEKKHMNVYILILKTIKILYQRGYKMIH